MQIGYKCQRPFFRLIKQFSPHFCASLFLVKRFATIYALSSGFGRCGVAVIRVSGSKSREVAINVAGFKRLPEPRKAYLRRFRDPETNEILDHGLFLYFAGPKSFTGEDSCELQVHGGSAVISSVLSALSKVPGCRPAEPGEFTKRAFYAGKFDLTEVEGLADLINAETEAQRHQALLQMEGVLNKKYSKWRNMLLHSLAKLEAFIDFSEEENIEDNLLEDVNLTLVDLKSSIKKHLRDGRRGEKTRTGVKTVIVGAPNVGKSSLLNSLSQQKAAIVSPIPGTTRDIVKISLDIGGYPVMLLDTAGLRNKTEDIIEQEGISRARASVVDADLILIVIDASHYMSFMLNQRKRYHGDQDKEFEEFLKYYFNDLNVRDVIVSCQNFKTHLPSFFNNNISSAELNEDDDYRHCLIIFNKVDIVECKNEIEKICEKYRNVVVDISCKTEIGFDKLVDTLTDSLKTLCGNSTRENPNLSQARHRYHLLACLASLDRYLSTIDEEKMLQIDIAVEHIRNAATELGKITGNISAEDVLDVVFKQFCIGK